VLLRSPAPRCCSKAASGALLLQIALPPSCCPVCDLAAQPLSIALHFVLLFLVEVRVAVRLQAPPWLCRCCQLSHSNMIMATHSFQQSRRMPLVTLCRVIPAPCCPCMCAAQPALAAGSGRYLIPTKDA
jgi:hypothetical protein